MRVTLDTQVRNEYFTSLKSKANLSWKEIAKILEVNGRMLRSWRSGELTIPKNLFDKVENLYSIKIPTRSKLLIEFWHIKDAARKGAIVRQLKYGDLGTAEGRRKGGLNSLRSPKLHATNFKFRKAINIPNRSEDLAELIGISIGDGGITHFQVKVTLGLEKDKQYAFFVKSLFEKTFGLKASLLETKKDGVIEVVVSSRTLVEFLMSCGLPIGNKIRHGIDIPEWIKSDNKWARSCLRGIFDTDGCVYIDKHKGKAGLYKSINIAFTSASPALLLSINEVLKTEGFVPTLTSRWSVRLRRSKDVVRFFEIIGSSNGKHLERYKQFLQKEEYPSGYTGTVSKTVGAARPT